jgi:RHS repeat-associated protein
VSALVNSADGTSLANYVYGPFGEVIRNSGPLAKNNPFRFSTKYQDDESDLDYYGYRYYKASTGTWPNRDPFGEKGGLNLYVNVGNNEISQIDPDGRGFVDCMKALAELAKWTAEVSRRVAEIQADNLGTGLDPGHVRALAQAVGKLNAAMDKVAKHCACEAGAGAAIAAAGAALEAALPYLVRLAPVM